MEFRIEEALGVILAAALAPAIWGQSFDFQVRHGHWRKGCTGTLRIDAQGVSYTGKGKHSWEWAWQDIQRFELTPSRVSVLTYKDNGWKFGADREYVFTVATGQGVAAAYTYLKDRLDQRFVARLADEVVEPLWEVPVKRLGRIHGSEGVLAVAQDRVVYESTNPRQSMTWRYGDIRNLSTSGPFQLSLDTLHQSYDFQLKKPLGEPEFNAFWRRLQQAQGLRISLPGQKLNLSAN
jgi:hypothetical protein